MLNSSEAAELRHRIKGYVEAAVQMGAHPYEKLYIKQATEWADLVHGWIKEHTSEKW